MPISSYKYVAMTALVLFYRWVSNVNSFRLSVDVSFALYQSFLNRQAPLYLVLLMGVYYLFAYFQVDDHLFVSLLPFATFDNSTVYCLQIAGWEPLMYSSHSALGLNTFE